MEREAIRIAVAVSEDLRFHAWLSEKRIVAGYATIVLYAKHLSDVRVECLCAHPAAVVVGSEQQVPVANGHVKGAVGTEHDASGESGTWRGLPRVRNEDVRDVRQRRAFQFSARDRKCVSARASLWVRKINEMILCKFRMDIQAMKKVRRCGCDARSRPDGLRIQHAISDHANPPGLFGNQQPSIRADS